MNRKQYCFTAITSSKRICEECRKKFLIRRSLSYDIRFCSRLCSLRNTCKSPSVRNARKNHKAPWLTALNMQPGRNAKISRLSAQKRGDSQRGKNQTHGESYVKRNGRHEHRAVMENHIGRRLLSSEIVHHKDHNNKNNALENLVILTRAEHARLHFHGVSNV